MSETPRTSLADFLEDLYRGWLENRRPLSDKWDENLASVRGYLSGKWKKNEAKAGRSTTHIGVVKQKVIGLFTIISDVILQGGENPLPAQAA